MNALKFVCSVFLLIPWVHFATEIDHIRQIAQSKSSFKFILETRMGQHVLCPINIFSTCKFI